MKTNTPITDEKMLANTEERLKTLLGYALPQQIELLGISKTSWYEYKAGTPLPRYVQRLLLAVSMMDDLTLEMVADDVEERISFSQRGMES